MANMLAWIVTTKELEPWDVEWLLGQVGPTIEDALSVPYQAKSDTEWRVPVSGGHIEVTYARSDYAESIRSDWRADIEKRLSGRLRRAKLASFVVMEYKADGKPDNRAAWFKMTVLSRLAAEYAKWPCLLCRVSADRSYLDIFRPEET